MSNDLIKKPTCATCKFFERQAKTPNEGLCKENSPQTTIVMVPEMNAFTGQMGMIPKPVSCWPMVTEDLWCGRYAATWARLDS